MSAALVVDTSVWVDHFAGRDPAIADRLRRSPVHVHEFVIGELMLGALPRGDPAIDRLDLLPRIPAVAHEQAVDFVRRHRLEGTGIGWIDAYILAAAERAGAELWTTDKSLLRAAARAGVAV